MEDEQINLMNWELVEEYSGGSSDRTKLSNLLLYGDRGSSPTDVSKSFFHEMQDLEILGVLHTGFKSLPSSISSLQKLRVLVVRGCGSFQNVNHIEGLQNVEALTISGTRTLKEIPDNFFNNMHKLKTLNLSDTNIESLPSSLSKIWRLEFLFLRGCSFLKLLTSLKQLESLRVLDLSDCVAFEGFQDEEFGHKYDLHTLDLSSCYGLFPEAAV